MSQNQLIAILTIILLLVIMGSVAVLLTSSSDTEPKTPSPNSATGAGRGFKLEVLEQQAYQLLNKQLVKEGSLPVRPPAVPGKANPFL